MAIKLIKACKELNIGMVTLLDFCSRMGYNVPADPNFRIDDDIYLALAKEFNRDLARKLEAGSDIVYHYIPSPSMEQIGVQSIAVENFRKFEKLAPVQLNGITYIVGGNNAGKSTVVKALRLVVENLRTLSPVGSGYSKDDQQPRFHLDIKGVNIGNFEKALNRRATRQSIIFKTDLSDSIFVTLVIEPQRPGSPITVMPYLRLEDKTVNCAFEIDAQEGEIRLFNIGNVAAKQGEEERIKQLNLQLKQTKEELADVQAQIEDHSRVLPAEKLMRLMDKSSSLNAEKEKLEKIIKSIEADKKKRVGAFGKGAGELLFKTDLTPKGNIVEDNLLVRLMKSMSEQVSKKKLPYEQNINKMIGNFRWALIASKIEYIGAHAATQKTIFSLDDHNDETVAIIHEWMQQNIQRGQDEYRLITDWMKELKIGVDFEIRSLDGEAYSVYIQESEDDTQKASLSELGMGAIQMMTLLLHLSAIMRKYKGNNSKPLIVFEEPEQNMHPDWQSHLADIFKKVCNSEDNKGFRIMVETHSEYIIRKSQVQVAAMKYADQDDLNDNCPIATYYFPANEEPYKMEYRTDGKFLNGFGNGFYDEAANLAFDIM